MNLNSVELTALQYVRNTGGGATVAIFIEDHEPIGERLWKVLSYGDFAATNDNGRIFVTSKGAALLDKDADVSPE